MKLERIDYAVLKPRQKENYNFVKISAVLADYGFVTFRLSDDWEGADFIALHLSGEVMRVQLKGRMTFDKKYCDKKLFVAFPDSIDWFLYPHDEVLQQILASTGMGQSEAWKINNAYSFPRFSKDHRLLLEPYRIKGDVKGIDA